jgi:hypothetical protein
MKNIRIILLTEDGRSPTEETLENYRTELSKDRDICKDPQNNCLQIKAGPPWNTSSILLKELEMDSSIFVVILLGENAHCPIKTRKAFSDYLANQTKAFPDKTSWQIAHEYIT